MTFSEDVLRYDELTAARLRSLYSRYGYAPFRMSRFEEYELYAHNKNFLMSDNIITFTDMGGRLMALRPDVTLSIVKGIKDGEGAQKLYYNENVYRPGGASREFKERMQLGLECIGDIDVYSMCEVITLARLSLETVSREYCLDISHMGYIGGLLECVSLSDSLRDSLIRLISEKNAPEIKRLCGERGLSEDFRNRVTALAALYGPYKTAIETLRELSVNGKTEAALRELRDIYDALKSFGGAELRLDFSLVNDMSYYSGVIFQGFINGIPAAVLSGGRYDSLLRKFGKKSGAIGFAVYLDMLGRLDNRQSGRFVDTLLLYDENCGAGAVAEAVRELADGGGSVRAERAHGAAADISGVKFGRKARLTEGGLSFERDD